LGNEHFNYVSTKNRRGFVACDGDDGTILCGAKAGSERKGDLKDAQQSTNDAAQDTGRATKKTAQETGHTVKHKSKKAAHKTAKKTKQGAQKVEDKTQPQ